jgi:hypothetical protein
MRRRTMAPRIDYSEAIPASERNLLDALMKPVHFGVFEYIVDEIWNIAINPLRTCGFTPYIQFMIESVAQEKFYKDVCHDYLCPAVPKDPRASHVDSAAAPSYTTHSGGAPSAPATNSGILKMLQGIFATCRHTDKRRNVMNQHLQIVRCNQEIIHSQWDEPLQEFPDIPIFPPVPDPYGSLTPAELAAFGIALLVFLRMMTMRRRPTTTRRQRTTSSWLHFIALFPFWCLDDKGGEESYLY